LKVTSLSSESNLAEILHLTPAEDAQTLSCFSVHTDFDCSVISSLEDFNFADGVEDIVHNTKHMRKVRFRDEISSVSKEQSYAVKFDSACSRNMSGNFERTTSKQPVSDVCVTGFNGGSSGVDSFGWNEDGQVEYFVSAMPSDLVLLSAHSYVQDGAAILLPDGGIVLEMDADERAQLLDYLQRYSVKKRLVVNNRTYEVAHSVEDGIVPSDDCVFTNTGSVRVGEEALNSTATRYFNSTVHVSND